MIYSTLDILVAVVSTRGLVTLQVKKLVVGATHTPSWYCVAAASSNQVEYPTPEDGRNQENGHVWPVTTTTRVMSLSSTVWNNNHEIAWVISLGHVPKDIIVKISRVE